MSMFGCVGGRRASALAAVCLVAGLSACGGNISKEAYRGLSDRLVAEGKLRTDIAPADAPFDGSDVVRSFRDIAFSYEFHFKEGEVVNARLAKPLNRWHGQIRWKAVGDAVTTRDRAEIARLTARIGALTGLDFVETSGRHDLLISIASPAGQAEISALLGQRGMPEYRRRYDLWRQSAGWICGGTMSGAVDQSGQLVFAHVFLSGEVTGLMRRSCLHEEISQILGLTDDSDQARPSIFNDDQEFALLTEHDALLLKVLYDPRLQTGMAREDAMPIVRRIVSETLGLAEGLPAEPAATAPVSQTVNDVSQGQVRAVD